MPTFNRTRWEEDNFPKSGDPHLFPGELRGSGGSVLAYQNPIIPAFRKVCKDVTGDHFYPYLGFGEKVEKDHDLLIDSRHWRYDNGLETPTDLFVENPNAFGPVDMRLDWEAPEPDSELIGWRPGPLAAFIELMDSFPKQWKYDLPEGLDHLPSQSFPSNPVAHLLARTNPSKPAVDVPAFVGELKDVPRLFQIIGQNLINTGGNAYLSYKFGWKPMLSDMAKMADVTVQVNKRLKTLRSLLIKGVRKSARIGFETQFEDTLMEYPLTDISPYDSVVNWKVQRWTKSEMWGSTRWSLPEEAKLLLRVDDDALRAAAFKSVFGLEAHPAALWELIPWSWLIDWFAHIQDILELLYYRSIPVDFGSGCICLRRHTIGNVVYDGEDQVFPGNTYRIGFRFNRSTKERFVFDEVVNTVSIPGTGFYFHRNQLSILAALVASKRKLGFF